MSTFIKRGSRWQVRIRDNGISASRTFDTKRECLLWARRYEPESADPKHTVRDLLFLYTEKVLSHKRESTRRIQLPQISWWTAQIGSMDISNLQPSHIGDALDALEGRSGATKRRYVSVLSHALEFAVVDRQWLSSNPAKRLNKNALGLRESKGRCRFLSMEERERLLGACRSSRNPLLHAAVLVALATGMRAGEQFGLTWDRVDLRSGRLRLEDTKNGESRVCHVSGPALDALRGIIRRLDSPYVFTSASGSGPMVVRTAWESAVNRAGLGDFRWHDLRHSFASELAMSGATLAELAEAMGHKTLTMVKRYAHLTEGHTSSVVRRMQERVFGG
ncbi:MAG: site-specific integrase [Nitrospirota bacterium]|nr:site-specific integrase [Nitrospirota bacterium]